MALSKRKLQIVRMIILLLLWGICAFFVIKLSVFYVQTGRKNTVDIETDQLNDLSVPWVFAPTNMGKLCHLHAEGCSFYKIKNRLPTSIDCEAAVELSNNSEVGYLVNGIKLRELGIGYENPLDFLNVSFSVRYNKNNKHVDSLESIPQECEFQNHDSSTWVGFMGDDITMMALARGETINEREMPAPVYIGFGNVASISYKLSQQHYLNGSIKNSTEFATTQYSDRPNNQFEVHILPATFDIMKIKHKSGQSLLDLLGSVFGWIGVFTGACIFSVLDTAIAAYTKNAEDKARHEMEAGKEPLYVTGETELSERSDMPSNREVIEELKALRAEVENLRYQGGSTPPPMSNSPQQKSYKARVI